LTVVGGSVGTKDNKKRGEGLTELIRNLPAGSISGARVVYQK